MCSGDDAGVYFEMRMQGEVWSTGIAPPELPLEEITLADMVRLSSKEVGGSRKPSYKDIGGNSGRQKDLHGPVC